MPKSGKPAPSDDRVPVALAGGIDADLEIPGLNNGSGPVEFDFNDVSSVNSVGIRAWVGIIKSLAGRDVTFVRCPPVVVRQINMVPLFLGHARVVSIWVPYVCDSCGNESTMLVESAAFATIPATKACNRCAEPMEVEVPADRMLQFLKRRPNEG